MSDILKIEKGVVKGLKDKNYQGVVTIPVYDDNKRITRIEAEAFANCEGITEVKFDVPDSHESITFISIGKFAFFNCKKLKYVTLSHYVNKIERSAFQNCEALGTIEMYYGIPEIASWTFAGCKSLTKVVIPNGVKYIGHQAFADCVSLKRIDTLSSETTLGYDVFQNVNPECLITVPLYFDERYKEEQQWNEFEIKVNDKRIFSYNGLKYHEIGERKTIAVAEKENTFFVGHANIPSVVNIKYKDVDLSLEVCGVEDSAFYSNNMLTSVHIPKSVAFIGAGAFGRCSNLEYFTSDNMTSEEGCFTAVEGVLFTKAMDELVAYPAGNDRQTYLIPESVKVIRDYAFSSIESLLRITFPNKKYTMQGSIVFDQANLTNCCAFIPKDAKDLKKALENVGFKMINAENFVAGGLNYKILTDDETGHTVEVCGNASFIGELKIPGEVEFAGVGYQVVSIGEKAFYGDDRITSLSMPKTIIKIKSFAFENASLSRITIPAGVEKIGGQAFFRMKNVGNEIEVPASVNEIGDLAFSQSSFKLKVNNGNQNYCAEDNVLFDKAKTKLIYYMASKPQCDKYIVPSTVTEIALRAFAEAKIKQLTLPASVSVIKGNVFYLNDNLEKISIDAKQPPKLEGLSWFAGTNPQMIVFVPKGCAGMYKTADGWKQIANQIIDKIPTTFQRDNINYKVVSMENKTVEVAVNSDASGAITIPSQVTHCGDNYTVIGIGTNAFAGNSKITDITWPDTIKYFGAFALYHVSLKKTITLPSSLESIENQAFWSNKLTFSSLNLPSGLKTIKRWAFAAVKALNKEVKIPASVCSIEYGTFQESNIERIKVDGGNVNYKSMDDGVLFSKNGDTLIEYPCANSRQTYTVPTKVTTIGNEAFCFCMNLKAIILPSTIKKIGPRVFSSSTSLELLDIKATTPPTLDAISFEEFNSKCFVKVPKGCAAKYKTAEVWKTIASHIVEDDTQIQFSKDNINFKVLSLDDRKVEVDESPKATGVVVIPNQVSFCGFSFNVVSIGSNAFWKNNAVTSLTIPSCTERILSRAFSWMRKMTGELKIPASVKEIDGYAFCYSTYRLKVDTGNQYYCTDDNVLFNKKKTELICYLECKPMCDEYKVPETVTKIVGPAFNEAKIRHLRLPASLKAFEGTPFYDSRWISKITIAATTPPYASPDIFSYFAFTNNSLVVIVPKGRSAQYKAAEGWKEIAGKIKEQ